MIEWAKSLSRDRDETREPGASSTHDSAAAQDHAPAPRRRTLAKAFADHPPARAAGATRAATSRTKTGTAPAKAGGRPAYPFAAIVGQEAMKTALLVAAVDPTIGGVLILGDRGTGKSTAIRSLAALLPLQKAVQDCAYGCDPAEGTAKCPACQARAAAGRLAAVTRPVPVVDLPLGATEDRIVGALDLERALADGTRVFQPGLLARAHRGFLYIDEVNLLEDHLVDLLIDVAASGENLVEREGLSLRHPARFVLVGSGNPEEGDLRPQLLDRFGLAVEVRTPSDIAERVEVVCRRDAFDQDPTTFCAAWARRNAALRRRILAAQAGLARVVVPALAVEQAARLCLKLGTDGLRGELTLIRAARALAALEGTGEVTLPLLRRVAPLVLAHRLRRNPLDDARSGARVDQALHDVFGPP